MSKIVLIGSGNVATHIGTALHSAGHTILQVFSKTPTSAKLLADKVQSTFTTEIKMLDSNADVYIIAIKDDAINELVQEMPNVSGIVVHTSGTQPMQVLETCCKRTGVFYPLQTFKKEVKINLKTVPFCIEGSDNDVINELRKLASSISDVVETINSEDRAMLHLAAVFACNFTNHLLAVSKDICDSSKLPFSLLNPLINQTIENALTHDPVKVQTGPAVRRDENIMKVHLEKLKNSEDYYNLYKLISSSIINLNKNNERKL